LSLLRDEPQAWDGLTPEEKRLSWRAQGRPSFENYPVSADRSSASKQVSLQAGNVINEIEDIDKWREAVKPAYDKKMKDSPCGQEVCGSRLGIP